MRVGLGINIQDYYVIERGNFMKIDYAVISDEPNILVFDKRHISQEQLIKAITDNRVCVATEAEIVLGYARFNFFWDSIPFLNMLYVPDGYNRIGVGSGLLKFWENEMQAQGYKTVLTSTMSNEKAQQFFRKHGYMDAGNLYFENEGLELILSKQF